MTSPPLAPTANRDLAFSGWLDFFRGLAAFAVVYGHARTLFLASVTPGQSLTPMSKMLYFLSNYGHQAVMVFFVLSGYLVGGTVIRAVREGRWSWGRYFLQRGTRLYIVLIPALLLTLCWDYGEQLQSAGLTPNDDTAVANIRSETIREHTSPAIFVGNVAFLQTVAVPSLGSNTPLWSLTNEFWYYLLFPLLWLAVAGPGVKWWIRLGYVSAAVVILTLLGEKIAVYFTIWLFGAVVSFIPELAWLRQDGRRRIASVVAAIGVLGFLVAFGAGRVRGELLRDFLLAVAFAALLYCMKHNRLPASSIRLRRVAALFADFSYTLYLVHLPPLIFLRACLTYEEAWPPGPESWAKLALILALVLGFAYLVSLATERQTERLRRRLERLVFGERSSASRPLGVEAAR